MKKVLVFLLFLIFMCLLIGKTFAVGKVEINISSLQQLDEIIGIGPVLAQRIIDNRPFSSVDGLIKVSGIGEKTLQKIKDQGLAYVDDQQAQNMEEVPKTTIQEEPAESPRPQKVEDGPLPSYPKGIVFNEILPSPKGNDAENEWIELYNQNDFDVDLINWQIQDGIGSVKTYILDKEIPALGYLVLYRPETKITLNNDGDELKLINPNEEIIDSVGFEKAKQGESYNRISSQWKWSSNLTPGEKNSLAEIKQPLSYNTEKVDGNVKKLRENQIIFLNANSNKNYNVILIALVIASFSGIAFLSVKHYCRGI